MQAKDGTRIRKPSDADSAVSAVSANRDQGEWHLKVASGDKLANEIAEAPFVVRRHGRSVRQRRQPVIEATLGRAPQSLLQLARQPFVA